VVNSHGVVDNYNFILTGQNINIYEKPTLPGQLNHKITFAHGLNSANSHKIIVNSLDTNNSNYKYFIIIHTIDSIFNLYKYDIISNTITFLHTDTQFTECKYACLYEDKLCVIGDNGLQIYILNDEILTKVFEDQNIYGNCIIRHGNYLVVSGAKSNNKGFISLYKLENNEIKHLNTIISNINSYVSVASIKNASNNDPIFSNYDGIYSVIKILSLK
jgi:hypothetical protein